MRDTERARPTTERDAATPEPLTWRAWQRSERSQSGWAALLEKAVAADDAVATARALDALGTHLSVWRGEGLDVRVVEAIQRLAVEEAAPLRRRVDARRLVPALEVLMDVGDGAALARVTGSQDGRAADPMWRAAAGVAEQRSRFTGRVTFSGGCVLRWNGQPQQAQAADWEAPIGTHSAACGSSPPHVIPVQAGQALRLHAVDGILVWQDPAESIHPSAQE